MRRNCITKTKNESKSSDKSEDDCLITFIIIADRPNARMRSYGPTSLLSIKNVKLLDLQIVEILKAFPKYEIILCTGFESDKVSRYIKSKYQNINIRIVENQDYENTNSCESLRLALNNTSNNSVFIVDGNVIFNSDTFKYGDYNKSCILFEEENPTLDIGININEKGCAEYIGFGASKRWSEICFLNKDTYLNSLIRHLSQNNFKKKFMFEAINAIINNKSEIKAVQNEKKVYKIQNIKNYHNIKGFKWEFW